jgi:hypothetical protein
MGYGVAFVGAAHAVQQPEVGFDGVGRDHAHCLGGRGNLALSPRSVSVNALCSIAFIGGPWPTNKTGIFSKPPSFLGSNQPSR